VSSDFANELKIDSQRAHKIINILMNKVDETTRKHSMWASIIRDGWQRMFETSELPIMNVDKILVGGLSAHKWFMNGAQISLGLAESIVDRFVTHDVSDIENKDIVEKAKGILDWDQILEILDQETIKVLGLIWLADKLSTEIMYPENEALVQNNVWEILEKNLNKTRTVLINHVENIIEIINETHNGVTSWEEVIRFS
jgi:hypothetical protein